MTVPAVGSRPGTGLRWSVVIPVHNCADYLARLLPEVLAQLGERDDAEILVVDDASSDDPARVVERLGRGRVRFLPNPGHLGAVNTFNRCVDLAAGEWVHLLHGDDLVRPGFYRAMDRALEGQTAVAAVCRVQDVDADDAPLYVTRRYRKGTGVWTDALDALAVSNRVRAPGIVVSRAAYQRTGGYRSDLPHAADWEMWTRLAAAGPIVFVDQVLAGYRRHSSSDTSVRAETGANIAERVTAIGVIAGHVPARQSRITRLALAYAFVFATRATLTSCRAGRWSVVRRQGREALRCAWLLSRGVAVRRACADR
jgi:glycosyltransferase involved in cell wall biosynthesis